MMHAEIDPMRLAATFTPRRGALRRAVALPGTLRDTGEVPRDIEIVDLSASGFLAELPAGVQLDPGTRIRVAATSLGRHDAVMVRREGRRHGFVFTQPLPPSVVDELAPQLSNVSPLFVAPFEPAPDPDALSPRASLALITAIAVGGWLILALLLYVTAQLF